MWLDIYVINTHTRFIYTTDQIKFSDLPSETICGISKFIPLVFNFEFLTKIFHTKIMFYRWEKMFDIIELSTKARKDKISNTTKFS